MDGKQREEQGNSEDIDKRYHTDKSRENTQPEGRAAMCPQPTDFSTKRPVTAGCWIINKHQCRIISVQEKDDDLTYPRNEIDKEGDDGNQDTEKGNFDSLEDVGKKTDYRKIFIGSEVFSGIHFLGGCTEENISGSGKAIGEKKSEIKSDNS
jgi:hypothetical protein